MEPVLYLIPHTVKDSFDFTQRLEKYCQKNTLLSMCDIDSLYTNIHCNLFLTATEYWIEHLLNILPLLQRFTKQFVFEVFSIILRINYFYINKLFFSSNQSNVKYTHKIFLISFYETTLDF